MYEFLEGRVDARRATRLVLNVNGVGYDLAVPVGASFGVPESTSKSPSKGTAENVRVWTHLVVREDDMSLYGFPDRQGRDLFRVILKVRGVGPSLALALLSGLPGSELLQAVSLGDTKTLTRIKGVGKKTAEQILLDLRDRANALLAAGSEGDLVMPDSALPRSLDRNLEDAVTALISLGYSEKDARKSVERAAKDSESTDLEHLVRAALAS